MTHKRKQGLHTKIYQIKNNFESYTSLEPVSQEYITNYIAYCLVNKNMKLSEIVFEFKEVTIFSSITPIHRY